MTRGAPQSRRQSCIAAQICAVLILLLLSAALPSTGEAAEKGKAAPKLDVEYEATPHKVVDAMLKLAKVGPDDLVIDLGSGDGRIPIAAAKTFGCKSIGVDLDPRRVAEAKANAEREGVTDKVTFVEGDLYATEIGDATVVTLFLWPTINLKLRPKLLDLTPGKRIVSHAHDMGDWHPDRRQTVGQSDIFLWIVPARIGGGWRLNTQGRAVDIRISQKYQHFTGTAVVDGRSRPVRNGRIDGLNVSFELALSGKSAERFSGHVTPGGDLEGSSWYATRTAPRQSGR
jgi:SAM-dependent methyltransferase